MSESTKMQRPPVPADYVGRSHDCGKAIGSRLEDMFDSEILGDVYQEALLAGWRDREIRVAILDYIEYVLRNEVVGNYDEEKVPTDYVFKVDENGDLVGSRDDQEEVFEENVTLTRIKGH